MESQVVKTNDAELFSNIADLIQQSRQRVAVVVNSELTMLYWKIGKYIKTDLLNDKRAEYGKQIVQSLSAQLTDVFGRGWSTKQLPHCLRSAEVVSDEHIELMRLEESNIKVATYLTLLPPIKLLQKKLHEAILIAKEKMGDMPGKI